MAELTLGLDVGPNSIGWSLVDEAPSRLLAAGVRVFPEGVDRDQQGGEKSKTPVPAGRPRNAAANSPSRTTSPIAAASPDRGRAASRQSRTP